MVYDQYRITRAYPSYVYRFLNYATYVRVGVGTCEMKKKIRTIWLSTRRGEIRTYRYTYYVYVHKINSPCGMYAYMQTSRLPFVCETLD